jgi:hypothetical protein
MTSIHTFSLEKSQRAITRNTFKALFSILASHAMMTTVSASLYKWIKVECSRAEEWFTHFSLVIQLKVEIAYTALSHYLSSLIGSSMTCHAVILALDA